MGCLKLPHTKEISPALKILYSKYPLKKNATFFLEEAQEKRYSGAKKGINLNPFGMTLQGRSFTAENSRFGYQGSERDPEYMGGNAYTTEFRLLDPRVGRWFSPDPILHPWQSPYTSMDNNPVALTDPFGLATDGNVGTNAAGGSDFGAGGGGTGTQTSSGDGFMTGELAEATVCGNCGDAGGGGVQTAAVQTQAFSTGGYSPMDVAGASKTVDFPVVKPSMNQSNSQGLAATKGTKGSSGTAIATQNANTDVPSTGADGDDLTASFKDKPEMEPSPFDGGNKKVLQDILKEQQENDINSDDDLTASASEDEDGPLKFFSEKRRYSKKFKYKLSEDGKTKKRVSWFKRPHKHSLKQEYTEYPEDILEMNKEGRDKTKKERKVRTWIK